MLVLRSSAAGADGVALNRPLAARGNRQLAELLLRQTGEEAESLIGPLLAAFGDDLCVYLGGPSEQQSGGLLVHRDGSLEAPLLVIERALIINPGARRRVARGRSRGVARDAHLHRRRACGHRGRRRRPRLTARVPCGLLGLLSDLGAHGGSRIAYVS